MSDYWSLSSPRARAMLRGCRLCGQVFWVADSTLDAGQHYTGSLHDGRDGSKPAVCSSPGEELPPEVVTAHRMGGLNSSRAVWRAICQG